MAQITTGLTNGGVTAHYRFSYDDSFATSAANPAGPEPARTNAVVAACENDYNLMSGWFGGIKVKGIGVQVATIGSNFCGSIGACWNGTEVSSTVQLIGDGQMTYVNNPAYLRYLLVLEVSEIFMMAQKGGWFDHNEGSKGEGLSRFLAGQFLDRNGLLRSWHTGEFWDC